MELKEITEEALKLTKKDKTALINALLESMSAKGTDDGSPKMPVYQALDTFGRVYRELKGTDYGGLTAPRNFAIMKRLLTAICGKILERSGNGMTVITNEMLVSNLAAFMRAVAAMPNKYYFNNRFTVQYLETDFEVIYSQIKNNSGHERAKRACDYL